MLKNTACLNLFFEWLLFCDNDDLERDMYDTVNLTEHMVNSFNDID